MGLCKVLRFGMAKKVETIIMGKYRVLGFKVEEEWKRKRKLP